MRAIKLRKLRAWVCRGAAIVVIDAIASMLAREIAIWKYPEENTSA